MALEPFNERQHDIEETENICSCSNNKTLVVTDPISGEMICQNCGQILSGSSSSQLLVVHTDEEHNRVRSGGPRSLARHDMGLSTIIGAANKDASGKELKPAVRFMMNRLTAWDTRFQISKDKSLSNAFFQLNLLTDKLGLSDSIIEKAAYIYRKAHQKGLNRGSTIYANLAAAVYIALRYAGAPRSLKEISEVSNIKRRETAKAYRRIVRELGLTVPMIDPKRCVSKIANKTGLSETTKRLALDMLFGVIRTGDSVGKNPMTLASSLLYLASLRTGENATQKGLANAAAISEVTLRQRLNHLRKVIIQ